MDIDLAAIYADFDSVMSWNPPFRSEPESHKVYFTDTETPVFDGVVMVSDLQVRFIAAEFDLLDQGDNVKIDGVPFRIREIKKVGFGKEKIASLARIEF